MYKSSRSSAGHRRRTKRRHHLSHLRLTLAGALAVGLLLTGAGRWTGAISSAELPLPAQEGRAPLAGTVTGSGPIQDERPAEDSAAAGQGAPAENSWNLILVNARNPLPEDYSVQLTQLKNGQAVDERCFHDLQDMIDACRASGLSPVICSAYRTRERQERLFQNQVDKLLAQGYDRAGAEEEAGKAVAVPGTSEHQLGLAVDLVDLSNQHLDESQENTAVQKWLMENSWKYGFILRYPNDKREITGIIYEPWHYRYVGKEAAREIYAQGLCLEEYLDLL